MLSENLRAYELSTKNFAKLIIKEYDSEVKVRSMFKKIGGFYSSNLIMLHEG